MKGLRDLVVKIRRKFEESLEGKTGYCLLLMVVEDAREGCIYTHRLHDRIVMKCCKVWCISTLLAVRCSLAGLVRSG